MESQKYKALGRNKAESEKYPAFYEECLWRGKQSPPAKYKPSYVVVDKEPRIAKITKASEWEEANISRIKGIKKKKEVSPCHYEVSDSFNLSQYGNFKHQVGETHTFDKAALKSFIDHYKKQKKIVPLPGHYKYDESRAQDLIKGTLRPD